jgi:hypothetical protein
VSIAWTEQLVGAEMGPRPGVQNWSKFSDRLGHSMAIGVAETSVAETSSDALEICSDFYLQ